MKPFRCLGFAILAVIIGTATTANAEKPRLRPIWGQTAGEVTFGNPGVCATQPVQTLSNSKGQLLPLGKVTLVTAHCASTDGFLAFGGQATLTSANGDQVFGTYTAHAIAPPPPPLIVEEGELIITGGTGRFEGATGRISFTVFINPVSPPAPDSKWPVQFAFEGAITY